MAANPLAVANEPSTWDTIKSGAIDGASWIGRQVQWLGSTIKDYAVKVFEWALPFFESIVKFFAERFDQVKELVANNKEITAIITATVLLTSVTFLAFNYLLCGGEQAKNEGTQSNKLYA